MRDAHGRSFPEAAELLLDVLEHGDNSGGTYDDDNALAALLEALGQLRLPSPEVLPPILQWPACPRLGTYAMDMHWAVSSCHAAQCELS